MARGVPRVCRYGWPHGGSASVGGALLDQVALVVSRLWKEGAHMDLSIPLQRTHGYEAHGSATVPVSAEESDAIAGFKEQHYDAR